MSLKVVLKCATTMLGVQYAMTCGVLWTLVWPADSSAIPSLVCEFV